MNEKILEEAAPCSICQSSSLQILSYTDKKTVFCRKCFNETSGFSGATVADAIEEWNFNNK